MKYEVTKPFGKYRKGQVVDDSQRYIRRKLQEGGCLSPVGKAKVAEKKMETKPIDNKMSKEVIKNKGGK